MQSSRARHTTQSRQQRRNIALSINIQAAQIHTKHKASQNSLLDTSLHSGEKSSSTHQNRDASFPKQETLKRHPHNWPTVRNIHKKEESQAARIQKGHPKYSNRTDAEAETPMLWSPDVKNWLIGKDPDAGKDWRQKEKGMIEDQMVWHHQLNGLE